MVSPPLPSPLPHPYSHRLLHLLLHPSPWILSSTQSLLSFIYPLDCFHFFNYLHGKFFIDLYGTRLLQCKHFSCFSSLFFFLFFFFLYPHPFLLLLDILSSINCTCMRLFHASLLTLSILLSFPLHFYTEIYPLCLSLSFLL